MNFGIVFIIFSYVQTILCSQADDAWNDTCGSCTVSWFRRKRAQAEYTRWRANQESSHEFIVKVLDDDVTTLKTSKIIAINIQALSNNEKKIIVGGALVPPMPSPTATAEPVDYTRFIPPTTVPVKALEKSNVRSILEGPIISPRGLIKSDQLSHKKHVKHVHRDESPPSGPQFLGRSPPPLAQQYAPVAPVSFHRGTTVAPLTPRSVNRFMYKTSNRQTHLFPMPDVIKPTRTTLKTSFADIFIFDKTYVTDDQIPLSPNGLPPIYDSQTSFSTSFTLSSIQHAGLQTEERFIKWRRNKDDPSAVDKESELSYDVIINDYEEDKENAKIEKSIPIDKEENQYEMSITDVELSKVVNKSLEEREELDNSTDSEPSNVYIDDEKYPENFTLQYVPTHTPVLNRITGTETKKKNHKQRKHICSMVKLRQLNFNSPRTLPEIVTQLKQWAETSPVAKWVDITNGNYTAMENPIYMMIVDDPSSGQIISAKKTVLIVAGMQGRDHHAVAAAMYVLYQLIERSEAHADLLTKYRFWIIPIFNPDGYDYSMTFPHKREWTKNLRQKWDSCKGRESCESCELYGLRCTVQACYGVNLDRNFEYQWIPTEERRAEHPCGALHAGARQLSEAESRALAQFLQRRRAALSTFIAFKEGDVLGVLYPYSHTRKRRAFDNVYRQRAALAAAAAYSVGGRPYVAGQTSEFLPLYAGGVEDWADGHLGVDHAYSVMMFRPSDSYSSKLITERVVHEAYAAMDTLLLQTADSAGPAPATLTAAATAPRARAPVLLLLLAATGRPD